MKKRKVHTSKKDRVGWLVNGIAIFVGGDEFWETFGVGIGSSSNASNGGSSSSSSSSSSMMYLGLWQGLLFIFGRVRRYLPPPSKVKSID